MVEVELTRELFFDHADLICEDPVLFRKRVIRNLRERNGWERKQAAQEYERFLKEFRKINPKMVEPLFKSIEDKREAKRKPKVKLQADDECFSVVEILGDNTVGRCQSFLTESEARAKFMSRSLLYPHDQWVLIRGLGPNSEDMFKLSSGERELERNTPKLRT